MSYGNFCAAVFAIFKNEKGEILFQKRQNTGFADGFLQLPSGHVEHDPCETIEISLMREMQEELDIEIYVKDVSHAHIQFNCGKATKSYFNFFFSVRRYNGTIKNNEPEKCEELVWIHPKDFEKYNIVKYNIIALNSIDKNIAFQSRVFDIKEDFIG